MNTQIPLVAVIGAPIAHSKSPLIHNHWLSLYSIPGHYVPIYSPPENLEETLTAMRQLGFVGANVTVPNKEKIISYCDSLSREASRVKAVNTIKFMPDGTIFGHNTDVYGFITNLRQEEEKLPCFDKTALVLGAGGAARAVLTGLLDEGMAKIYVTNRTLARAEDLANEFGEKISVISWEARSSVVEEADYIVNTTILGMHGERALDLDLSKIKNTTVVNDIVYTPLETPLLREARLKGAKTVDGLGMLLHQAVPGFEKWFGKKPQVNDLLREKLLGA